MGEQTAAVEDAPETEQETDPVVEALRESVGYWQRRALRAERKLRATAGAPDMDAALEALAVERERFEFVLAAVVGAADGRVKFSRL